MGKLKEKLSRSEGLLSGLILKNPELILDYNINKKLLSEEALFYIGITDRLLSKGIEKIDEVSFINEVNDLGLDSTYEKMGGYSTIKELMNIVDEKNSDHIVDEWTKYNLIKEYKNKGILDIDLHWNKLISMTSSQVCDYLEYQIQDVDINVASDIKFETLSMTEDDIKDFIDGVNIGLQYGKKSPFLNYLTMGVPKSEIYFFGGYTNSGKSSYIFENMVLNFVENKHKCCVISNEQKSISFKVILLVHVLTEEFNYWKLTRKKIKAGKYTEEDLEMINKANEYIKKEIDPYLQFVKIYDFDTNKVNKIVKKLSKVNFECFFYDTFKVSDSGDGAIWERLLEDSKELFKAASKYNIAMILSVQLALHTKNKVRFLDEGVLSNGKQISECASEIVYMRDIWEDEFKGEPNDIKPFRKKKDSNGKFTNENESIELDKDKKYKLMFLSKTRNDSNGVCIVYEFDGAWNKWKEIGQAHPSTKNRY